MTMKEPSLQKQSRLVTALREAVTIVQMILFKEIRHLLSRKFPENENSYISILAGTITNELFGTLNPDEKFMSFHQENRGIIEQELLGLSEQLPKLRGILSDALRIQALCDSQEGNNSARLLNRASELGLLVSKRDIPLPSIFMTRVRELGANYNLIIPPVQVSDEDDRIVQ